MIRNAQRRRGWWVEPVLAAIVAAGLVGVWTYFFIYHYLPQPFFYEPQDTWMDWFNTAYWAHHPGSYDTWGTIYPPLSFALLKVTTYAGCYNFGEQYPSRECDLYGKVSLHLIYLLNVVLTARAFVKIDRRTALPRSFTLVAGLPMLFALERGNLILACYTCLLLAYGPLLRSARWRWVFAACAINFKVYLVGTIFAQLLRRRWRWFEGAALATVLVYLVTFAIVGEGTPAQLYNNIYDYSSGFESASLLDLWYAITYRPLLSLLQGFGFPILTAVGSHQPELWGAILPVVIYGTVALIGLAALAAAFRPAAVPLHRLVFLSIAAAVILSEAGGYTQVFLILFVFMEKWRGFGRIWSIVCCYILSIPADIPLQWVPPVNRESYLYGGPVIANYAIGIGPFLRPGLVISMAIALSLVSLRQVLAELQREGWRIGPPAARTGAWMQSRADRAIPASLPGDIA